MFKTAQSMIDKINNILLQHRQKIRVIEWSGINIMLSNGMVLTNKEKHRFVKRITNTKTDLWVNNIDMLLHGKISEKEIKSQLSAIGGKACQCKHGDTLKQNLNTGIPWNRGTKGQNVGTKGPLSQSTKDKISLKNSGVKNGMYGVKMSESDKQIKSSLMKKKILAGEFTPNSNNRNTHWNSKFDNKAYRSSWEALYQYINQSAEYETLRIEYELNGNTKIYIVDFVNHLTRQVIEVKPQELCYTETFKAKINALQLWANTNNYTLLIVDKDWLTNQNITIDYNRFDKNTSRKIKALYETNQKN